eukprot:scaffold146382_cov20-Tisochrysis_lutea.AAC.3
MHRSSAHLVTHLGLRATCALNASAPAWMLDQAPHTEFSTPGNSPGPHGGGPRPAAPAASSDAPAVAEAAAAHSVLSIDPGPPHPSEAAAAAAAAAGATVEPAAGLGTALVAAGLPRGWWTARAAGCACARAYLSVRHGLAAGGLVGQPAVEPGAAGGTAAAAAVAVLPLPASGPALGLCAAARHQGRHHLAAGATPMALRCLTL